MSETLFFALELQGPEVPRKAYIGDSVYVEWDPQRAQYILTTENGYGPSNTIYLEESVLSSFLAWLGFTRIESSA